MCVAPFTLIITASASEDDMRGKMSAQACSPFPVRSELLEDKVFIRDPDSAETGLFGLMREDAATQPLSLRAGLTQGKKAWPVLQQPTA